MLSGVRQFEKSKSGGSLLYDQCVPFAILKPKNRNRYKFHALYGQGQGYEGERA
jgi:hypothetical protein